MRIPCYVVHVAGPPSRGRQHCTLCGVELETAALWPEGQYVGHGVGGADDLWYWFDAGRDLCTDEQWCPGGPPPAVAPGGPAATENVALRGRH